MKIKKISKTPAKKTVAAASAPGANASLAAKNGTIGKKAVTTVFIFALAALLVSGTLVYVMYRHWEFLMPA
jgi:hypothetical protein